MVPRAAEPARRGRRPVGEREILATGKNVLVLGGGDTGSDCIGTSHRRGAKHVYNSSCSNARRSPSRRAPWPASAAASQILRTSTSHEEGGSRDWGISTTRFTGANGRVEAARRAFLRPARPRHGAARDGRCARQRVRARRGSGAARDGVPGPEPDGIVKQLGVSLTERGNIATNGYASSVPRVYAAGDMRRGQSLVVWAIAEGRQAAEQIDRDLQRIALAAQVRAQLRRQVREDPVDAVAREPPCASGSSTV
jgi:glutamate synthase (NADPH/NADH) small chain